MASLDTVRVERVAGDQAEMVVVGVDGVVGGVGYLLFALCLVGAGDTGVWRLECLDCLLFICLEIFCLA